MNQLSFVDAYRTFPYILTEGAIVERLRHEFHIPLDEHLVHAALIYDDAHRDTLAGLYKQYIDIAASHDLPLMLMTPTHRANVENIAVSAYRNRSVIPDVFFYHSNRRAESKKLANRMKDTFESKYGKHQPNRGFTGTVSGRNLYVLTRAIPVSVFVELGNIQNSLVLS